MKTKISLQELKKAYYPDANDIEDVFKNANINRYSIWKPTSCYTDIKKLNLDHIKEASCSLKPKVITSWGDPSSFETLDTDWEYLRPGGGESDPFRLGDFRNYNPDALPPLKSYGNITVNKGILQNITSSSLYNIKVYSRFSDSTYGLKGLVDDNILPLNYVIDNLKMFNLGVAVYVDGEWIYFTSNELSDLPDDEEALYNPDGTLQDIQYLNRLPRFGSNIEGVRKILNSSSNQFWYIPFLQGTSSLKYTFPGAKPSIMKIEDYEFDQEVANDAPDRFITQFPDGWFISFIYERDANGLVSITGKNGKVYYRGSFYLLNKTNPEYLNYTTIKWSLSFLHWSSTGSGSEMNRSPNGTFKSNTSVYEEEFNGKKYYGRRLATDYVDMNSITGTGTIDQDLFYTV